MSKWTKPVNKPVIVAKFGKPKQTNSLNTPLKPELTLKNKEYLKNLKESKFNLTETYRKTYPNASPESANAHCTDKLKQVVKSGKITIESLIDKSNMIIDTLYDSKHVKLEKKGDIAVQLTKRQVTDKQQIDTKLTPELKIAMDNYDRLKDLHQN